MSEIIYFSKESFEKMKKELQQLKSVDRPAASKAIAEAREKGDLKENAEYDAAKDAQGMLEGKIAIMEGQIANARIVDESQIDTSKAAVLTKVTITNLGNNKAVTYQLVGEQEANLKEHKLSITSPIGKGLIGKEVGEIVEITAPNGKIQFRIDHISL